MSSDREGTDAELTARYLVNAADGGWCEQQLAQLRERDPEFLTAVAHALAHLMSERIQETRESLASPGHGLKGHDNTDRRTALGLVLADLDQNDAAAGALLGDLDRYRLARLVRSLAQFVVEIVAPEDRAEFRAECASEALVVAAAEVDCDGSA